jgi:hypothetical protein
MGVVRFGGFSRSRGAQPLQLAETLLLLLLLLVVCLGSSELVSCVGQGHFRGATVSDSLWTEGE